MNSTEWLGHRGSQGFADAYFFFVRRMPISNTHLFVMELVEVSALYDVRNHVRNKWSQTFSLDVIVSLKVYSTEKT
jgi:hypothetical protein